MNTVSCCGQVHRSPFCPACGRKINNSPLTDLLLFCRNQSEALVKKMAKLTMDRDIAIRQKIRGEIRAWDDRVVALEALMIHATLVLDQLADADSTPAERNLDLSGPPVAPNTGTTPDDVPPF